jgi:hypothetical protein
VQRDVRFTTVSVYRYRDDDVSGMVVVAATHYSMRQQ